MVADDQDCDDGDAEVHPGATDGCDGRDEDCDGEVDEECPPGPSGEMSLADAEARLLGTVGSFAGWGLDGAGDVNGDGFEDILVSAYKESSLEEFGGAAYLVNGPVSGDVDLATMADASILGSTEDQYVGYTVSGIGDIDADGFADIGVFCQNYGGIVGLFNGPLAGEYDASEADALFGMMADDDYDNGLALVAGIGDTNDDGFSDFALANHYGSYDYSNGIVHLVHGPVTGAWSPFDVAYATIDGHSTPESTYVGYSVAGAGDMTGDGLDDVAIGTRGDNAWLLDGQVSGEVYLGDVGMALYHEGGGSLYVDGAGDVNADGYADVLVGTVIYDPGPDYRGTTFLVLGPVSTDVDLATADAALSGESEEGHAGYVGGAGDVDADGHDDIIVGAVGEDDYTGRAYLLHGPISGAFDLPAGGATLLAEAEGDRVGSPVAGAGDINDDSYADVLVGANGYDDYAGAAYLVLGGP